MRSRHVVRAALVGALCVLAACTKGGRSDYVRDGDTGAAAPATMTDANHPTTAQDSNPAVTPAVNGPTVAGDKVGARGAAANPNAAPAAANTSTTGPKPTSGSVRKP